MRRVRSDGFEVCTDPARLDHDVVRGFLREAPWSRGIPDDILDRALEHSIVFGLFDPEGRQAGFARVLSDRAVFAYLADVFVLPRHRRRGLGAWLVRCALDHPELQGLRRWYLVTTDAHGLYHRFGFGPSRSPHKNLFIERSAAELYGELRAVS